MPGKSTVDKNVAVTFLKVQQAKNSAWQMFESYAWAVE
jgi:hypothetical protein